MDFEDQIQLELRDAYDDGYQDGYDAGYQAALESRE
jgi:flagellar biosynthesis/type III secretory pathway protein FliH